MAKSLSDIVSLVKHGDDNILEEQEKANATLESIDRNMKAFLDGQKNDRLDNLEDRREKKRPSSGGGAIKGAAIGAAAGGALSMASGDRIDPTLLLSLGAGVGMLFRPVRRAIFGALSGMVRNFNDLMADVDIRVKILQKEIDARIKTLNEEIELRKKAQADSIEARKKLNADIEAGRLKMTVQELIADGEARAETRKRTQAEIEKFQRQADNLARNKKALQAAVARAGKARRAAVAAIELDMESDPRSQRNLNRSQYGGALDTRADRALMQTGTENANRLATAASDRGLMATADEQTRINQNRAADRRLAEQAQERSRRLQLGSDASSAADKRKFNADVRAAALQLEAEQLRAANLKKSNVIK